LAGLDTENAPKASKSETPDESRNKDETATAKKARIRKQRAALDDLRGKLGKHQDELSLELTGTDGRPAGDGSLAKSQRQQIKWTQEQIIGVEALLKNLTDERAGEIARVDSRRKEANQRNANN
jgi:hypothetical protein